MNFETPKNMRYEFYSGYNNYWLDASANFLVDWISGKALQRSTLTYSQVKLRKKIE